MSDYRIPIEHARQLAQDAIEQLFVPGTVSQYHTAGSIRRGKPIVGDIELVCQAERIPRSHDLFGNATSHDVPLERRIEGLLTAGILEPRLDKNDRQAMGSKYKRLWFYPDGQNSMMRVPLDLFIVHNAAQYGLILAIRTGPSEFSRRLVTQRPPLGDGFLRHGWRVEGGWLLSERGTRVPAPSEFSLFSILGMPLVEPQDRETFVLEGVAT